jgi:hypothetical protein
LPSEETLSSFLIAGTRACAPQRCCGLGLQMLPSHRARHCGVGGSNAAVPHEEAWRTIAQSASVIRIRILSRSVRLPVKSHKLNGPLLSENVGTLWRSCGGLFFLESAFIDQAALNGTRPNSPSGVKPARPPVGRYFMVQFQEWARLPRICPFAGDCEWFVRDTRRGLRC